MTAPSQPHTSGDQELSSDEEQWDGSDFSRSEDIVRGSPDTSDSTDRSGYIVHTNRDAVDADYEFNQEKLTRCSVA